MKILFVCLFSVFLFLPLDDKEKVVSHLLKKYPIKDTIFENDLVYYPETEVKHIKSPFIEKKWGIRFFTTNLTTSYYCYRILDVLLSINSKSKIYMMPSPSFTSSENILWQFSDTEFESEEEKYEFIQELGNLISKIMYQGQAKNIKVETDYLSIRLYENNQHCYTIKTFYDNKRLKYIQMFNSKEE